MAADISCGAYYRTFYQEALWNTVPRYRFLSGQLAACPTVSRASGL
jgi:hypothetical protein